MNWFNKNDIQIDKNKLITLNNINGYVLPHAGTKYTSNILSHTLRFKPQKKFNKILIIYYPSNNTENVIDHIINKKYYHEYYVVYKTLEYVCKYIWDINNISFESINMRENNQVINYNTKNTLFIVSADFSHFLNLHKALKLEDCAAHMLMYRRFDVTKCTKIIDDAVSFKKLYEIIPKYWQLQWIGRSRSPGENGVGYLSFLIINTRIKHNKTPDGFFVTAYDKNMNSRECLGNTHNWNKKLEINLINEVIHKASNTSRLTHGKYLNIPITNYTVTYLFKDTKNNFIRGYHAIMKDALYLPDVFLENTFENGKFITKENKTWVLPTKIFNMNNTFSKLEEKAKTYNKTRNNYTLFATIPYHYSI